MQTRWLRTVPTLAILALLAIAALSPRPGARASDGERLFATLPCDLPLISAGGTGSSYTFPVNNGVTQPLELTANAAACSLTFDPPAYVFGRVDLVQWDPLTLAPDPTTIALRSRAFDPSQLQINHVRADFMPAVVIRQVPHLADPPHGPIALNYTSNAISNPITIRFDSDGPAAIPTAYAFGPSGVRTPLPGTHPVLSHQICGGSLEIQNLFVTQSVMTTSLLVGGGAEAVIQRVRVPVETRLEWIEFAFGGPGYQYGIPPGVVQLFDAEGQSTPPFTLPAPLTQAYFNTLVTDIPFWSTPFDFDTRITLAPDHDYWIKVQTNNQYSLYGRTLTGTEGADFTSRIGGFFYKPVGSGNWIPDPGKALSFRMIGEPLGLLDAPSAGVPGALRLRVAPNPARGVAFVAWSGAAGAVRFEVLDARGRHVADGGTANGAEGRWALGSAGRDGRPLPAGVYFVRARDDAGHSAVERVVLVR